MNTFSPIHSHRELIVWQRAIQLVCEIYALTKKFPKQEVYGLTSQMRRSAVSIPSNIAEGRYRGSRKDFIQFLRIAYASGAELETQIEISKRLQFCEKESYKIADAFLLEIMKMLNAMITRMNPRS